MRYWMTWPERAQPRGPALQSVQWRQAEPQPAPVRLRHSVKAPGLG